MVPDTFEEVDFCISNFDHEIDSELKDAIVWKEAFGRHAGRNFNGMVYHQNGKFHEDVWQHHLFITTKSADSLKDLMEIVNDEFGWE